MKKQLIKEVKQLQKIAGILKEDQDGIGVDESKVKDAVKELLVNNSRYLTKLAEEGNLTPEDFTGGGLIGWMEDFDDDAQDDFGLTDEEAETFSNIYRGILQKAETGRLNKLEDYVNFLNTEAAKLGKSKMGGLEEEIHPDDPSYGYEMSRDDEDEGRAIYESFLEDLNQVIMDEFDRLVKLYSIDVDYGQVMQDLREL